MNDSPFTIRNVRALVRRVGVVRVALLFLAIQLPIAIVLSFVISLAGQPANGVSLAVRAIMVVTAFGLGGLLFVWLLARADRAQRNSRAGG